MKLLCNTINYNSYEENLVSEPILNFGICEISESENVITFLKNCKSNI